MITININDVSRDLPGFLQRLHAGETVFIVQDDLPVAELKPLPAVPAGTSLRPFGLCAGEFVVPDDFDAPLPDDLLAEHEGK